MKVDQDKNPVAASSAPFKPRRLTHINWWVENVENIRSFYLNVVGVNVAYERPLIMGVFMTNGNTYHDFAFMDVTSKIGAGKRPSVHHFAFELERETDLVAGYNKALERGYKFDYCMSADVAHSIYTRDPDGNSVELYADVIADWRSTRTGVISKPKSDWKPGDTPPVSEACYPANPLIDRIDSAALHMKRTAHVALAAEKYEEMFRYYRDFVGLVPLFGSETSEFSVFGGTLGEKSLSLFRSGPGRPKGVLHTGLEVVDDEDFVEAKRRLAKAGVSVVSEVDHKLRHCVFIDDPNGNRLQFFKDGDKSIDLLRGMTADEALTLL